MLITDNVQNESQVTNLNSSIETLDSQSIQLSQTIKEIEKCMKSLEENASKFPWENRVCYAEWLAQCYYQTSYTPRMEALALSRYSTNSKLFPFFIESLKGELGHENLALRDLQSLGYSIDSFPELPATSSYYHSIFYLMDYESSLSILGYRIPLEGFASQDSEILFYEKMRDIYGESSTSFLKVHALEDVSHHKQGLKMLEMCDTKDLMAICKACQQLAYVDEVILEAIKKKHL
ncbi:iron-containing redox enzyme family protein [Sphaerospermopsis sp. LEGE 08334]|jgi:hypothetical protein|uniref:iron-containing redox enzyme family protein n=1 Tax=Sphaerospermopsis sp. LEGE 08334 TaxID=1828651 RepID=UPI00188188D3|nr:iron-containing redox enzyme family protein [Sphaerospermopsis sp. LEGE 08334]MBE9056956.1 hypothetical protein [Sphaerospermopsis sp. LEGE 08334]